MSGTKKRKTSWWKASSLLLLFSTTFSYANSYALPELGSNIVGRTTYHVVEKGQSMADIADQYGIGLLALMAANRGVDPFLPPTDYVLTLPTRVVLPQVPREGIVVNLAELRLYYYPPKSNLVHVFPVGIGRIGRDTPVMNTKISQKREQPTWTPTQTIRKEYLAKGIELPKVVPAGPDNPLGEYALRLSYGVGEYLIHGTNKDFGIGLRVSSGCIRMNPSDIEWLFQQVSIGTPVQVINQPIKVALEADRTLFIEAHEPLTRSDGKREPLTLPQELGWWMEAFSVEPSKAKAAIAAQNGLPVELYRGNDDR